MAQLPGALEEEPLRSLPALVAAGLPWLVAPSPNLFSSTCGAQQLSLIRTLVITVRAYPGGSSRLKILNLISCAEIPFPCEAKFMHSRQDRNSLEAIFSLLHLSDAICFVSLSLPHHI